MARASTPLKSKSLDLNLLRTFVVLWETRSVIATSERLSVTQPAISHALRRLRDRLDDELFVPGYRGLSPTARAIELIGPVREALEQIYRAVDHLPSFNPENAKREFGIASLDFVELWLLPNLVEQTFRKAPGIVFRSMPIPASRSVQATLEGGEADFVIDTQPSSGAGIVCHPLSQMPLATLIWKREKLTDPVFPLDLFLERPHVVSQQLLRTGNVIEQALEAKGLERRITAAVANNLAMAAVAARTGAVCTMPVKTAHYLSGIFDLSVHVPPIPLLPFSLYSAWHKRSESDPAHLWLRGVIESAFPSGNEALAQIP